MINSLNPEKETLRANGLPAAEQKARPGETELGHSRRHRGMSPENKDVPVTSGQQMPNRYLFDKQTDCLLKPSHDVNRNSEGRPPTPSPLP